MGVYLVTGATGALGGAVVERLLESNPDDRIRVFVRSKRRFRARFPSPCVEIVRGNVLIPLNVRRAVRNVDGFEPRTDYEDGIRQTVAWFEEAA